MDILMTYSEAGGQNKTTTAVSLATISALRGRKTMLIDLDPRGAATMWMQIQPDEEWQTTTAIIGHDEKPYGWAGDLAVPCTWSDNLSVVPSGRKLSNLEGSNDPYSDLRLKESLDGLDDDMLVVIDCPNRQGGVLTRNALSAANGVLYTAAPDQDGWDGYIGAQRSVKLFSEHRADMGAPVTLEEKGIVVGRTGMGAVMTRVAKVILADFEDTGEMLTPVIPTRTAVNESRIVGKWYGDIEKGKPVAEAYEAILDQVVPR